jgi:SAM-dependent methyltransferase
MSTRPSLKGWAPAGSGPRLRDRHALLLANRGFEVIGVDPAGGSLEVAPAKPGSKRVHWIQGDATALPPMQVDLVTMTANVAQVIVDPLDWEGSSTVCMTRAGD